MAPLTSLAIIAMGLLAFWGFVLLALLVVTGLFV